jgi:FlaA1/EpsC-like NDP-sugar epimerase
MRGMGTQTRRRGFVGRRLPRSPARWFAVGLKKYGAAFAIECVLLYTALLAYQAIGYLGRSGNAEILSIGLLLVPIAMAIGEATFRLYRRIWVVAGLQDAIAIALAVVEAAVILTLLNWLIPSEVRPYRLPVPLLAAPTAAAAITLFRLAPRLLSSSPHAGNRLLMVVFDEPGFATIKALIQRPNPDWSPTAIISADWTDLRKTVTGVRVVGHVDDLAHWIRVIRADGVAFVTSARHGAELRRLFTICLDAKLPVFAIPGPDEWLRDENGSRLRRLSADDLVGRTPWELEVELAAEQVVGRTIMVTGAAGSIGSELCRLLVRLNPGRLVLLDNNESGLFDIGEELRASSSVDVHQALVSIVDRELLLRVFIEERPSLVFHAAAYKHVPMLETHPEQAVLINVLGTRNTLRCAAEVGVERFVLVSTDKAVAKHSVMGCTKRMCELMVVAQSGPMACWAVRFGNVVGSRGSVVPIFERQIQQGGPVTITHPDVSRYLMTIREAAALIISTLRFASPQHLYMLDMGEPIRILDLAHDLIRARGLRPGIDIEIVSTGLRPGERLHEELLSPEEGVRPTAHAAIRDVISPVRVAADDLDWTIERLATLAGGDRTDELVRVLKRSAAPAPSAPTATVEEPSRRRTTGEFSSIDEP